MLDIGRDGKWIPLHGLGNILGNCATQNVLQFSDEQVQAYAEQKDIQVSENIQTTSDNFLLLTWNNYGFSLAKKVANILKNKMI